MSTGSGGPMHPQDWQQRIDSLADRLEELANGLSQLRYNLYQIRQDIQKATIAQEEAPPLVLPSLEHPPVAQPAAPQELDEELLNELVRSPNISVPEVVPVVPAEPQTSVPPRSIFAGKLPVGMVSEEAVQSAGIGTPPKRPEQPSSMADALSSFRNISNLEARMGGAWLAWLGGLCVLLTAAWFFKYAIDQGWVNPWMRVSAGWLACVALVGLGEWACRRSMPWFAAGITGAGLGIGYIASYAASPLLYGLVSVSASYGILSLVTALGLVQAVRLDQLPTAVLALLGGFITLVLVRSDHPTAAGLLGYLIALNIGALGAGQLRRWAVLRLVAWPGTTILTAIWLLSTHKPGAELGACLTLMPALFVMYQLDMFYWRIRQPSEPSYIINTLSSLNCAAILLAIWHSLLSDQVALIAGISFFALAALQVILARALWVLSAAEQNRRVSITFYGQASMAAAVGFPVAFERMLVVAGWAVQAVTLSWLVRHVKAIGLRLKVPALLIASLVYVAVYFHASFMMSGAVSVRCWLATIVALAGGVSAYLFALWYRRSNWSFDRSLGEVCAALATIAGVTAGATLWSSAPSIIVWIWMIAAAAACLGLLSYKATILRMPLLMACALMVDAVLVVLGFTDQIDAPALTLQTHVLGTVSWGLLLPVGIVLSVLAFWNAWVVRHAATTRNSEASGFFGEVLSAGATLGLLLVLHDQLADDNASYVVLAATGAALVLSVLARLWPAPAYWLWSTATWTAAMGYWLTAATIGERCGPMEAWVSVHPFANATFAAALVLTGVAWMVARSLQTPEQLGQKARNACKVGVLLLVGYSLIHATSFEVDRWFLRAEPPSERFVTYMEAITLTAVWTGFALVYLLISMRQARRSLWWFSLCVGAVALGKLLLSDTWAQRAIYGGLSRWLSVSAFVNPAALSGLLLVAFAVLAVMTARRSEWLTAGGKKTASALLPVIAAYAVIHVLSFEVDRWFLSSPQTSQQVTYMESAMLTLVWAGGALACTLISVWLQSRSLWWFGLLTGVVTAVKLVAWDTCGHRFTETGGVGAEWLKLQPFLNPVLLSAVILVVMTAIVVAVARHGQWLTKDERESTELLLPVPAAYLLLHALSFEIDRWFQGPGAAPVADVLYAERVSLSVLWALLALAYIVIGLKFTMRSLRLFGLVIFAVTAGKVLLHDMAKAAVIYRMLSVLGLGVLSLIGSYAYQRVRRLGMVKGEDVRLPERSDG